MDFDNRWEALLEPGKTTEFFTLAPRPNLDPGQSAWSLQNAWWLAELCRWVYRNDDRGLMLADAGLREQQFFSEGATQCAIVRPHEGEGFTDFAVLVFRQICIRRRGSPKLQSDSSRKSATAPGC